MEITATKPKDLTGSSSQPGKGNGVTSSLGGFAATFNELAKNLVTHLEGDPTALAAHTVLGAVHDRVQAAAPADENAYGRRDDFARDQAPAPSRAADAGGDRFEDRYVEPLDDAGHEQATGRSDDRPETPADDGSAPRAGSDEAPTNDDHARASAGSDDGSTANRTAEGTDENVAAADGQSAASNAGEQDQSVTAAAGDAVQSQVMPGQQNAEQMLAGLMGMVQASELPGQMEKHASGQALDVSMRDVALEEISAVTTALGKRAVAQGSGNHNVGNGGQQAQANADAQAQADARSAAANTAAEGARNQAAQLSRMVGDGNRVAVNVNVANEAAQIVSQPASTLAASTVLAGESGATSQRGQQASHPGGAQAGTPAALQAAQQAATAAATGQAQQAAGANAQAQTVAAAAADAKAAVQAGIHAGSGAQQAQAAGAEATAQSNAGNAGEATQAQKAAASQAALQPRPAAFRQAVIDQVTVQITKAVTAGADKINIQLKPASLGRIDVQLEVAPDGRVNAIITADNRDTLEMLQRDARDLARALQDAGLHADAGSMSFNLREQGQQTAEEEKGGPGSGSDDEEFAAATDPDDLEAVFAAGYENGMRADGRVDIRA